ncbi:3'-5' exonuclease [Propionibacterium australiense]|uniref:DNA 3'-5' helicase n=1 Tax=Propionibacterium australiense TaxID=119981 RepID=A0A383S982_9ACTN|nr:3'-5' exonuclease [Propionibacterium australiense]RLP06439.1 DNA helicase UvrD [Propionibacterium australiense]RLP06846.1 DNA helicase UvrD [Propionibacterium australiense]SYZ34467.1 UvrD-like helicase C-terminal domain [Propionibacterium australiense]VEH89983.1 DNA-dependent helicase II [Propionibacterium australiense]
MAESFIVMSKQANKLDNSLKQKAYSFLEKLGANDETPGLHVERIERAADPRVRTGRVDRQYRAVLFRLDNDGQRYYVVHGIYNHDEAIDIALRTRLTLNPVNGMPNFDMVDQQQAPVQSAQTQASSHGGGATAPAPVPAAPVTPVAEEERPPAIIATVDELVTGLGFSPELAARAVALPDEDALLALAEELEGWRGSALLDLHIGKSIDSIREELGLTQRATAAEEAGADSDEAIIGSFQAPAARMEFAVIEGADALRAVIDGGDFGAWRVFLHPTQRRWVEGRWNGPARLTGGAGTGKTVVVLHRADSLLRQHPKARVIATTFTRNLADELDRGLRQLNPELPFARGLGRPGAYVSGIDALATAVLRNAGEGLDEATAAVLGTGRTDLSRRTREQSAWRDALDAAGGALAPRLRNTAFLQSEYEQVILPNLIATETDYLRARRDGRGVRLNRAARKAVWQVVERYRADTRLAGTISHAEAAAIAAAYLEQDRPITDHVLVDEGQDLSACHWRLVRALVADGPDDIFIAEDSHQRIYGARLVLSRYGINTRGRSRRLTLNYRTTAQILGWATGVLEGGDYVDLDEGRDSVEGYRSARSGPRVRLIRADSMSGELDRAAQTLSAWLAAGDTAPETLAVLVRARATRDLVVVGLAERGVPVTPVDKGGVRQGRPVVMTMHRAKGTEFAKVLLFDVSQGSIPAAMRVYDYDEAEHEDAMLRERSLLYVAASRARDELAVTWNGEASELLGSETRC